MTKQVSGQVKIIARTGGLQFEGMQYHQQWFNPDKKLIPDLLRDVKKGDYIILTYGNEKTPGQFTSWAVDNSGVQVTTPAEERLKTLGTVTATSTIQSGPNSNTQSDLIIRQSSFKNANAWLPIWQEDLTAMVPSARLEAMEKKYFEMAHKIEADVKRVNK